MKFVKCNNFIVNASLIKAIVPLGQYVEIDCTDKVYRAYFNSDREAINEVNRIYKELEQL